MRNQNRMYIGFGRTVMWKPNVATCAPPTVCARADSAPRQGIPVAVTAVAGSLAPPVFQLLRLTDDHIGKVAPLLVSKLSHSDAPTGHWVAPPLQNTPASGIASTALPD